MVSFLSSLSTPILGLFLVAGCVIFLVGIYVFIYGVGYVISFIFSTRRKDVFQKISKEYGLRMDTQKYSWNSIVIFNKPYPLQRMVGTVRGHSVCIEDIRSSSISGRLWYVWFMSNTGNFGRMGSLGFKLQTEMTVDGTKQIISGKLWGSLSVYKEIKVALDAIV